MVLLTTLLSRMSILVSGNVNGPSSLFLLCESDAINFWAPANGSNRAVISDFVATFLNLPVICDVKF
jgi:hypothetical protein